MVQRSVAVATCQGKTQKGKACKNPCIKGSGFCRVHSINTEKDSKALAKVLEAQRRAAEATEYARKLYENYRKRLRV